VDAESGRYLAGKNADGRLPMGSTDEMMVALIGP
jgi:D-alanyl-D-alanine carboxypeptidase